MEDLNIKNLVKATFPFSKHWTVAFERFVEKGISEWPTWYIVIHRGSVFNDHLLLTICEHADYTRMLNLGENFSIPDFKESFQNTKELFYYRLETKYPNYSVSINEFQRLYNFLQENNITLFEPTE